MFLANFLKVYKITHFTVYFYSKIKFKVKKNVLNSFTLLKRYRKASLNVFFNKKFLTLTKIFYLYYRFFKSN